MRTVILLALGCSLGAAAMPAPGAAAAPARATTSATPTAPPADAEASAGAATPGKRRAGKPDPAEARPGEVVSVPELARILEAKAGSKPLLIHIGFRRLFRGGHIPGSRYVGAASTPEGLAGLARAVRSEPRSRPIVLYCGCCPWADCPNVRPALREMRRLGFSNLRVLMLPQDFWTDWSSKGLPVTKGD